MAQGKGSNHHESSADFSWIPLLLVLWRLRQNLFQNIKSETGDATQSTHENVKAAILQRCILLSDRLTLDTDRMRSESLVDNTDNKFNADLKADTTALNPGTQGEAQKLTLEGAVSNVQLGKEKHKIADVGALAQRAVKKVSLDNLFRHSNIADRIMRYCFPGTEVVIFERCEGASKGVKQRKYQVKDGNTRSGLVSAHDTTYFASYTTKTPSAARISSSRCRTVLPFCTSLLRVRKFSEMAIRYLYGRSFRFQCSAKGAEEFLIFHRDKVRFIKRLVLFYHFSIEEDVTETRDYDWRSLMRIVRHEFAYIPSIKLYIGDKFWEKAAWDIGVNHVLAQATLRNDPSEQENFLFQLAKVAAPADRWYGGKYEWPNFTCGTSLRLSINGATTDAQKGFLVELRREIERRRERRPLFVKKKFDGKYAQRTFKAKDDDG